MAEKLNCPSCKTEMNAKSKESYTVYTCPLCGYIGEYWEEFGLMTLHDPRLPTLPDGAMLKEFRDASLIYTVQPDGIINLQGDGEIVLRWTGVGKNISEFANVPSLYINNPRCVKQVQYPADLGYVNVRRPRRIKQPDRYHLWWHIRQRHALVRESRKARGENDY